MIRAFIYNIQIFKTKINSLEQKVQVQHQTTWIHTTFIFFDHTIKDSATPFPASFLSPQDMRHHLFNEMKVDSLNAPYKILYV